MKTAGSCILSTGYAFMKVCLLWFLKTKDLLLFLFLADNYGKALEKWKKTEFVSDVQTGDDDDQPLKKKESFAN